MHGWRTTLFLSEDYFPMCRKVPPIIQAYLKFLSFLFCFSLSAAGIHYTEAMRAFVRDWLTAHSILQVQLMGVANACVILIFKS